MNRRRLLLSTVDESGGSTTAPYGVSILHTNGKFYTSSEWNTAMNSKAVGIAVVDSNASTTDSIDYGYEDIGFLIALEDCSDALPYGGEGTLISGIASISDGLSAYLSYDGRTYTNAIIEQLGSGNAPAAEYCKSYTFKDGRTGYLGSSGEWGCVLNNLEEVDACLTLLNKTNLKSYWTSTQRDSTNAWCFYYYTETLGWRAKSNTQYIYARAFGALTENEMGGGVI